MSKDFDQCVPAFIEIARRIFEAGAEFERKRILAIFPRDRNRVRTDYGTTAPKVRAALVALYAEHKSGIRPYQIINHLRQAETDPPNDKRIRDALKEMRRKGELHVVERGIYIPKDAEPR